MILFILTGFFGLIGHVLLWTGLVNQIAARNFPSFVTRLTEKSLLLLTVGLPVWLGPWWYAGWANTALLDDRAWHLLRTYVHACALLAIVVAARVSTRRWWSTAVDVPTSSVITTARGVNGSRPVEGSLTRLLAAVPGNQICDLEINEKRLAIAGLPPSLEGLAIAHVTDLHITGRLSPDFYRHVFRSVVGMKAEVIALTGDIIDYARHLDWLELLGELRAPDGSYFVLGNHDKRVGNVEIIRRRLRDLGWTSVGGLALQAKWRGQSVLLAGNEMPWLGPPPPDVLPPGDHALRVALLHSPDQLRWARRLGFQLALAGHTHGGQVRFPGIGAVLTPSRYGTRYACGVFHESPTVMHVSRGVSALHPIRYNCRPEITRLVLQSIPGVSLRSTPG